MRKGLIYLILLLLAGVGLRLLLSAKPGPDPVTVISVTLAAAVTLIPPARRTLATALDRLRTAPPKIIAPALFAASYSLLLFIAHLPPSYLKPTVHDEFSYALGSLMLSKGHFAYPASPAPESFESFHIFSAPVYGSIYPPGTALLHVPGVWLGVPHYLTSLAIAAGAVMLVYLLFRKPLGGDLALLASLLLLTSPQFRSQSTAIMSQVPSLTVGLALLCAAARWREKPTVAWALAIGALAGLTFIVRTQDAVFFVPAAALLTLRELRTDPRRFARHVGLAILAAVPCVALFLAQNQALTGSTLSTGYWAYTKANQPGTGFLFSSSGPTTLPSTSIQQKLDYVTGVESISRNLQRKFWRGVVQYRTTLALHGALPALTLAILLPAGLLALWRHGGWAGKASLAAFAGFAALYGSFTFFVPHYVIPVAFVICAAIAAVPLLAEKLEPALGSFPRVGVFCLGFAFALSAIPKLNPQARLNRIDPQLLQAVDTLADTASKPAVILVRYKPGSGGQEPVYNLASPDLLGNTVLRAHDLGPEKNAALFRWLSTEPAPRSVYLLDAATRQYRYLGKVNNLLATPATSPAPSPSVPSETLPASR